MINHERCNTDNEIKFSSTMLRSILCDYNDAQILVNGAITIKGAAVAIAARNSDASNKQASFENCAQLPNSISEINNTQINNAKDLNANA